MSQRERRIQRIAVGVAGLALLTVAVAMVATWRADRLRSGACAPASRHVAAGDLVKLRPPAVAQAEGGVRVIDPGVVASLGLSPGDVLTAVSGRRVARVHELSGVLRELGLFRPSSVFVELVRDREPVLVRWELDGDLDTARRADVAAAAAPAGGVDPRVASVRQRGRTSYEVPRATVEAWTADPALVTDGGRGVPVVDGERSGFRIYAIRPGSAYAALGFENGDVVRAINGTRIESGQQVLELVARSNAQISVDLVRSGQPMILNYLIK